MEEEKLQSNHYQQVEQRMATEEATCQLQNAESAENNGDYDDDEEHVSEKIKKDPMAAAGKMANALQDGGVDKAAEAGAQAANMAVKGLGKMMGKGFGSFF